MERIFHQLLNFLEGCILDINFLLLAAQLYALPVVPRRFSAKTSMLQFSPSSVTEKLFIFEAVAVSIMKYEPRLWQSCSGLINMGTICYLAIDTLPFWMVKMF